MGVSKNKGKTPQIIPCLIGLEHYFINHPFWGENSPIFGNIHIYIYIIYIYIYIYIIYIYICSFMYISIYNIYNLDLPHTQEERQIKVYRDSLLKI